jgi:uncharacterized membrane protein YGL010W
MSFKRNIKTAFLAIPIVLVFNLLAPAQQVIGNPEKPLAKNTGGTLLAGVENTIFVLEKDPEENFILIKYIIMRSGEGGGTDL